MTAWIRSFPEAIESVQRVLRIYGTEVEHTTWQGLDLGDRGSEWHHWEVLNQGFSTPMPATMEAAQEAIKPNLPWAEDHFQERVSGQPLNPGKQYKNWPHWTPVSEATLTEDDGKFTHTYMERFWPRHAGGVNAPATRTPGASLRNVGNGAHFQNGGIRYRYGDLNDLVELLERDPLTRQAYLPIFFPEDTGAVHGGRIPCTLGYHFMLRGQALNMWYEIRSCDFLRHFRDDLYMAVRLAQWVLNELVERELRNDRPQLWVDVDLGDLAFLAHSMHVFMGDRHAL